MTPTEMMYRMMSHAFWQQDGRGRRFDDVAATPPSSMRGKSGGKLKNASVKAISKNRREVAANGVPRE